ncbi:MAG TPA: hypothetical protein VJ814_10940 [Gaiellaceae bacterium]|nr:hypothetical protein [Gaiellaceae bacterium]
MPQLPGEDLVQRGLKDLAAGVESVESLLVSIGSPRLAALGLPVENAFPSPEHRLYKLLAAEEPDSAHSRYNALVRRLVSYESAAELRASALRRADRR